MKKDNYQAHATMLALVGGYMFYIAWQIYGSMKSGASSMAPGIAIALAVVFVLAGFGVLYYAWSVFRSGKNSNDGNEDNDHLTKQ